jgi:hypothetical protein
VTAFVRREDGKLLVIKRSDKVTMVCQGLLDLLSVQQV